jgi:hypothetical protein
MKNFSKFSNNDPVKDNHLKMVLDQSCKNMLIYRTEISVNGQFLKDLEKF